MSLSKTFSASVVGVEAFSVEIEVSATCRGESEIVAIVGLPDAAVRESRERVRAAMISCGFLFPLGNTVIGLAPADLKKEGAVFDLPIALGVIGAADGLDRLALSETLVVGELALNGTVRSVRGVLPVALQARTIPGLKRIIVPLANAAEAAVGAGPLPVFGVQNLMEAVELINGESALLPTQIDLSVYMNHTVKSHSDFSEVKGQMQARRALEIAAAGGHNVLLIGPPGTGKSMLSKRLPTILPPMTLEESIESTRIHSVCGQLPSDSPILRNRPFRAPHHTVSDVGLIGGQSSPTPGEISLAHNGVLFLDELPEFKRTVLEVMRQPLENGSVTVTRAAGSFTFPARFVLVAAMNPCPCGYYGSMQRECRCTSTQIQKYRARISGPLLDRIDIHVEVGLLSEEELINTPSGESSTTIRNRVISARSRQNSRLMGDGLYANAQMEPRHLHAHCQLDPQAQAELRAAISALNLSARAYDRILRVARTIADLADDQHIQQCHMFEAIQYRQLDRQLW